MFNPTLIVIDAFICELRTMYERTYGVLEPGYPASLALSPNLLSKYLRPVTHPTTVSITLMSATLAGRQREV